MRTSLRTAALALALPGVMMTAAPAAAASWAPSHSAVYAGHENDTWQQYRTRHRSSSYGQRAYAEPVYAQTPVWRGNDGRYYCKKKNGTTGLIIGGAAGALLGREIAGRGNNTMGMILGGAAGALLGRHIERHSGSARCR
jgi:hypothetical protein